MKERKGYQMELFFGLILLLCALGAWYCDFTAAAERAQDEVLRLHILAASDREEDQNIKRAVRDRLLKESTLWCSQAEEKEQAEEQLQENLSVIAAIAEDELEKQGCKLPVTVQLCRETFPSRCYAGFVLPAGEYDALRVLIGEGQGQNWWCVLYPSLCLSASLDKEALQWFAEHDLQPLQTPICFEPRFALLDWIQNRKNSKTS